MGKFEKKTLRNIDIINIINYINYSIDKGDEEKKYPVFEAINKCPIKIKWAFHVNTKALESAHQTYQDALKELENNYNDDDHSFDDILKDENGNPIKDENGDEQHVRSVKDEYVEKFKQERMDLLIQENEVKIMMVDIEDFEGADIDYGCIEALSFMIREG